MNGRNCYSCRQIVLNGADDLEENLGKVQGILK
jgi:hypothetical protein